MVKIRFFLLSAIIAICCAASLPGQTSEIPPLPALPPVNAPVLPTVWATNIPAAPSKPIPPAPAAAPLLPPTPEQKQAAAVAKAQIQTVLDQMDQDFESKQMGNLLAHRTADFSVIASHHVWTKRSDYGNQMHHEFATLVSAQRHSVVHMVTLNGDVAHAFVSQHGTITTVDPRTKRKITTEIDQARDDTFVMLHGHWLQHLSTTLAEIVIVNGKKVNNT